MNLTKLIINYYGLINLINNLINQYIVIIMIALDIKL